MQFFARRILEGAVLLVALGATGDASASDCLTSGGKTACGFHCVSGEGQVRCAQTPTGVCSVSSGVVACWDPPAVLRRAFVVAHGEEPLLIPAGFGSLPNYVFTKLLGIPAFVTPYANPDEANHAPNENMTLDCFYSGLRTGAALLHELGQFRHEG